MTIDTDRTLSVTVFRKDTHTDQYLNFQSNNPLHQRLGLAKTLFHSADHLVSKPDDMLSEQKRLRQYLNQCGYKNSIIDHAISFNKRHYSKTATQIQKNKCYVTLPYYGELSENMKIIIQDYDISTQFTAVNTLKNSKVHPKGKQQIRQRDVVYEICCNPKITCQDAYIGETSQRLQHRLKQHCRSNYNGNDSTVIKHIIASGHNIDKDDVIPMDRDKNWFERGVKEAVLNRTKNP